MKIPIRKLPALAVALGGLALSVLSASAALVPNPQAGDIFIGFRASSGDGAATSYLINIGSDTIYRNAAPGTTFTLNSLGNIGLDLISNYGEEWFDRGDLQWGIFGHRTAAASVLYGSRARGDSDESTPWPSLALNARNGTDVQIGSVLENIGGYKGREATANSAVATFQPNFAGAASYNQQVATPGTSDFGSLSQWTSIESDFGDGVDGAILDLFRIASDVTNVGSFSISEAGIVSFTAYQAVPEPSTYALIGIAATLLTVAYFRKQRKLSA